VDLGSSLRRDVAKPVRKILRAWSAVVVKDYPSTTEGLSALTHLMLMLAIRNKAFLKALHGVVAGGAEEEIQRFHEHNQALVANLSMIRSGQAGVADVAEMVSSVKQASKDFVTGREAILSQLDEERTQVLLNAEWTAKVFTSEIAKDMDQASKLIWESLDEALDSEWLDSNIPWSTTDDLAI
jgi:hypothetical protein